MRGFITSVVVLSVIGLVVCGITYYIDDVINKPFADTEAVTVLYIIASACFLGVRYALVPLLRRIKHELAIKDLERFSKLKEQGTITEAEYSEYCSSTKKNLLNR